MAFFFSKLKNLNYEFLDIIDSMRVQMSDFSLRIEDVVVDKYTQDSRVLKMKLWQHFTDILRPHRTFDNKMEVLDITFSLYTQPNIQVVFKMQEVQQNINQLQ